jgi:hypothetical protein
MPPTPDTQDIPRLSPQEVQRKMRATPGRVHLVCAYDDEDKCRKLRLAGARTLKELEEGLDEIPTDDELVFYCA